MTIRSTPLASFVLAASMALILAGGCGSKPTVNDTAEVNLPASKAPAEPARTDAPTPAPEPAK